MPAAQRADPEDRQCAGAERNDQQPEHESPVAARLAEQAGRVSLPDGDLAPVVGRREVVVPGYAARLRPARVGQVVPVDDRGDVAARADAVCGDARVLVVVERPDAAAVGMQAVVDDSARTSHGTRNKYRPGAG